MKKLNWNSIVKVKLTDLGKEMFRAQFDELNKVRIAKGCSTFERPEPRVDQDGCTSFQLWTFIELYGAHIGMGLPSVAEDICFYINDEDLEEVN